jgi:DNA-directed RNA polymerase subunit RPC12/RpoP
MTECACSGCGARLDRTVTFHPGTDIWRCPECGERYCEFCKADKGRECPRCHADRLVRMEM